MKTILHSKRANMYYLEHCRVMQKDGRVLYLTQEKKENRYWNIPIANTTVILLGSGTSITQAAVRMLASAGVLIGFCGGGGTPLLMGNEVEWLTPQNEYRPTEYMQGWMAFWFDEMKRLEAAKYFQVARLNFIRQVWHKDKELKAEGFVSDNSDVKQLLDYYEKQFNEADSIAYLLQLEALFIKKLYKVAAQAIQYSAFVRNQDAQDAINVFLNHGNYLAYGLAASTLWVLGIPHSFAVLHGKTRRGALVFDVADLIKAAIILPWAFICAKDNATEQEFRQQCLLAFSEHNALDFMFDQVKAIALKDDWETDKT